MTLTLSNDQIISEMKLFENLYTINKCKIRVRDENLLR